MRAIRRAELVIYPQVREVVSAKPMRGPGGELTATDIEHVVDGYTLAYYVHTELENGAEETLHTDYLIDASSGGILQKWDALETAAAIGTGYSEYSGTVSLGTNSIAGGWELRDVARGMSFATYNLNHATSGTGTLYTDTDNVWGDGANYVPGGSTTSANGQTAAVDAHYGVARTYDYYYNVLGRNGIDGAGTATYSRVHYSSSYDNAFWADSCFCMTYGDGSNFKMLTSLDVAGHEMSHGVTSRTAGLVYSGESGGLNESMSDIGGTMVEFYARGGSGSTIGNSGGNWTIGEQLNGDPAALHVQAEPRRRQRGRLVQRRRQPRRALLQRPDEPRLLLPQPGREQHRRRLLQLVPAGRHDRHRQRPRGPHPVPGAGHVHDLEHQLRRRPQRVPERGDRPLRLDQR